MTSLLLLAALAQLGSLALAAAPIAVSAQDPGLASAVARALAADGRPAQAIEACPGCVELHITGEDGAYLLEVRRGELVQRGEVRAPGKSRFEQARTLSLQALLLADALEAEAAPPEPPPAVLPPPAPVAPPPVAPTPPVRPSVRPAPLRRPTPTEPHGGAAQPTPGPAPPVEHVEAPSPTPPLPPESAPPWVIPPSATPPLEASAPPAPTPVSEPIHAPALAPAPTPVRASTRASTLSLGIAPDHPLLQALWRGPEHPHLALTVGLGTAALTEEPAGWSPLFYVGLRAPLPQLWEASARLQLAEDHVVLNGAQLLSVSRDVVVLSLARELPYRFHLGFGAEIARVSSSDLLGKRGDRYHETHLAPGAQLGLESRWSLGRFALSASAYASVHARPLEELLADENAQAWYPRWSAGLLLGADASLF